MDTQNVTERLTELLFSDLTRALPDHLNPLIESARDLMQEGLWDIANPPQLIAMKTAAMRAGPEDNLQTPSCCEPCITEGADRSLASNNARLPRRER